MQFARTSILAAALVVISACAKAGPEHVNTADRMKFENLRGYRHCEVVMVVGNPITQKLHANFYNTTNLNNAASQTDSCPDDLWAKVDATGLKRQYDVLGVFKDGPRYWTYDWIELSLGQQREFNGMQARWMGNALLPRGFAKGAMAFKPTTVERQSFQGYRKGRPVFILDDPGGTPWIMQAFTRVVDKSLTVENLPHLGAKLALPPGWRFRATVLEEDLELHAINGVAHIMQDNLQSTYNACFEEAGQKACSYRP